MEPTTIIVTALATGATAALKSTAGQAIKDAYTGIKTLIQRKYERVSLDMIEADPTSKARQAVLEEDLAKTDASNDEKVLRLAKAMLDVIQSHAPEAAGAVGVNLEEIKAASLKIDDIIATGTGVNVRKAEIGGDIEISGVRAGKGKDASKK